MENEIDDKINNLHDTITKNIDNRLNEVGTGIVQDLKKQIIYGRGTLFQNVTSALVKGDNNVFRNMRGRLEKATDSLVGDVKTTLKTTIEEDEDLKKISKFLPNDEVDMNSKNVGNVLDENRTNVQLLFINEKAKTRRLSWPATRNDYLGNASSSENIDEVQSETTKNEASSSRNKEESCIVQIDENEAGLEQSVSYLPAATTRRTNVLSFFRRIWNKCCDL